MILKSGRVGSYADKKKFHIKQSIILAQLILLLTKSEIQNFLFIIIIYQIYLLISCNLYPQLQTFYSQKKSSATIKVFDFNINQE